MKLLAHWKCLLKGMVACCVLLGSSVRIENTARADSFPEDPAEDLRQFLKSSTEDMALRDAVWSKRFENAKEEERAKLLAKFREEELTKIIKGLDNISALRKALAVEWRIDQVNPDIARIDTRMKGSLAERFRSEAKNILRNGSLTSKLAVLQILTDPALFARVGTDRSPLSRSMTEEVGQLALSGDLPEIRRAAMKALGQMLPDPSKAAKTLGQILSNASQEERVSASEALVDMIKTVSQLALKTSSSVTVEVDRTDVVDVGKSIIAQAAVGYDKQDDKTRWNVMEAIRLSVASITQLLPQRLPSADLPDAQLDRKTLEQARTDVLPVVEQINLQAAVLARAIKDPNQEIKNVTLSALDEAATARARFTDLYSKKEKLKQAESTKDDPLVQALKTCLASVTDAVSDPSDHARLAANDILEAMGPVAAPAVPALVKALQDRNKFVRWSAARALGKIGPVQTQATVPALARLLEDDDLALRLASASALERLGEHSVSAVGALSQTLKGTDLDLRVAALHAIEAMGTAGKAAIPALVEALADKEPRMRQFSAELLGKYGAEAKSAESALRLLLNDSDGDVRRQASDSIISILK